MIAVVAYVVGLLVIVIGAALLYSSIVGHIAQAVR